MVVVSSSSQSLFFFFFSKQQSRRRRRHRKREQRFSIRLTSSYAKAAINVYIKCRRLKVSLSKTLNERGVLCEIPFFWDLKSPGYSRSQLCT